VAVLARRNEREQPAPLLGLCKRLAGVERPEPSLADYDALLGRSGR